MKQLRALAIGVSVLGACGGNGSAPTVVDLGGGPIDGGAAASAVRHLVVIVQENHSFDSYFGTYCTAPPGSNPRCTGGPACCEAGPKTDPGTHLLPTPLDDLENALFEPNHTQSCENAEINGGRMDRYVTAPPVLTCGNPLNFAYASSAVARYRQWAGVGALADRYFQPVSGQSSSNLVYFLTARYLFTDNRVEPDAIGAECSLNFGATRQRFNRRHLGDLLDAAHVSWAWYAEGYTAARRAGAGCAPVPADCPIQIPRLNPCTYEPSTVPAAYFDSSVDRPDVMRDLDQLFSDLTSGNLPSVVFVRGLDYHTEHPGYAVTISKGIDFVTRIVEAVNASSAAPSTLLLLVYDESGGYFDHVPPPAQNVVDGQPYGPRVPLLALGPFARPGFVSHVVMEHSSIVRFIEWNWLGATGQLGGRDAVVHNIGSLLAPAATGVAVPED